ncbi:ash family protein [Serratia ureilytica]|nr:ash family protein [Serratia ureilytica]MBH2703773.1 ash family protein [Serratia ureilytica]MBH2736859.1 ash family protein [Serratia ureilytica]
MRSIERPGASYGLPPCPALRYSPPAAAQSAAGRENPCISKATQHAPGVFFFRRSLCLLIFCAVDVMLSQQSINGGSGGAAFGLAGILRGRFLTPVWATTLA